MLLVNGVKCITETESIQNEIFEPYHTDNYEKINNKKSHFVCRFSMYTDETVAEFL